MDPPGLLGMGHVPVENGTITFVVALRHNEVFEAGHELEKCPGLRRALLGSEAPGRDNIRKNGRPWGLAQNIGSTFGSRSSLNRWSADK